MKLLTLTLVFFGLHANAQSLNAGLWKARTNYKVNGIPLPHTEDEECISKSQAKDVKATLSSALQKRGCEFNSWKLVGQELNAELHCKKDGFEATGIVKGSVTPTRYDLITDAKGKYKSIPSIAQIHLVGDRIQDCKATR